MSKSDSHLYSGTKGHITRVIESLPKNPKKLLKRGWTDISHPKQKEHESITLKENDTGLTIRFDKGTPDASGYRGKDHYHIYNPSASGNKDLYLDKEGNPVPKNSKKSHIIPKED